VPTGDLEPAVWQARRSSFGSVAAGYAALRPTYPADAVGFLLGERPRRVLDVGAGTGLLTGVLLAAGHQVVAVDPAEGMLAELRIRHPGVQALVGGAEHVPLPDAAVDAVVAGQAAHWFAPAAAAAEMRRVLRPRGVVGLVWNIRDEQVPWVGALGRVLAAESRDHEADQRVVEDFARELGAHVERFRSGIVQRITPQQVVDGIATRSYVATMDDARRAAFLAEARAVLDTHPDTRGRDLVELPYRTDAYRLTPAER
jgi:SAM-dependent methyltransferase